MTTDEYKHQLERHDWFYYFTDDNGVFMAGESESARIRGIAANGSDDLKRAYNEAHAKRFNVPSFVFEGQPYKSPFPNVQ